MEVKTPNGDCGVIVARFQTPALTSAHRDLIQSVRAKHKKFIVVLGVSRHIPSQMNPLDYATRQAMVQLEYPGTIVLPLNDNRYDDVWSDNLDTLLQSVMPVTSFVLYGGRDSFINHYHGKFPTVELENAQTWSGTDARKAAFHDVLGSEDFRAGICYATANQYPRIIPTVDVAIVRGNMVLLGRKPGERGWRFIGGYAEKNESYERTAQREASEEAGINTVPLNRIEYIGSSMINDWRYAGSPDQIKTTFFVLHYPAGPVMAGDDIEEVSWQHITHPGHNFNLMPEHEVLWNMFVEWWVKYPI